MAKDEDLEARPASYRSRALGAVGITAVAQASVLASQMSSVIVLGRLLTPDDFGLMAMAAPLFSLIALLQDLGLTQAVIQSPDLDEGQSNALFWVNIGVSTILGLMLVSAAPFAASYYHEPRIYNITIALGAIVGVIGVGLQPRALLNRRMQFGRLALLDSSGALLNFALSALFAFLLHSYWALLIGWGLSTLLTTLGSLGLASFIPAAPRAVRDTLKFLRFGAGVTSYNLVNFFYRNTDNLLIGRFWGRESLGLYDRAYKLLLLPTQLMMAPMSRIMVPMLSRLNGEDERYASAFTRALTQVLTFTMPGIAFSVSTATLLIPTLLGPKWIGAGPIFAVLGCAAPVEVLDGTIGWLLISQGRVRDYVVLGMFSSVIAICAFVLGLPDGAIGVARAYAISDAVKMPIVWWWVVRSGPIRGSHIALVITSYTGLFGIGVLIAAAAMHLNSIDPVERLAFAFASSYAGSFVCLLCVRSGRVTLLETLAFLVPMRHKLRSRVREVL